MNKKKIEEIIELMERYGLSEIDVEEEGVRVHLKKGSGIIERIVEQAPHAAPVPAASAAAGSAPGEAKVSANTTEVKAPMVGTFYRAASPDSNPYCEVGSVIKEGDVLCILEAMKLMNEIKSEVSGKIVEILVANGEPVEFGQVIFIVEKQ
ncbi:MAG: acetyl-CoA carboxylase biotin carboxyl carrier protein [Candidatus Omnitrophota bacterium]